MVINCSNFKIFSYSKFLVLLLLRVNIFFIEFALEPLHDHLLHFTTKKENEIHVRNATKRGDKLIYTVIEFNAYRTQIK